MDNRGLYRDNLRKYAWIAIGGWSVIVAGLLAVNISFIIQTTRDIAIREAQSYFRMNEAIRIWATTHGGVYVPVDDRTPPNPRLEHVPERDIATPSGKKLTLMNPAYMLRQMNEDFRGLFGIEGHITSLKLFRKENAPDEWEKNILEAFDKRTLSEAIEFTEKNREPYLRLMMPMLTKDGCLKCHGIQGYKVGDIRGGISVAVPMEPFLAKQKIEIINSGVSHGVIWLLGILGISVGYRIIRREITIRDEAREALRDSEARTRAIVMSVGEGIVTIDKNSAIQFVNQELLKIFGYDEGELVGKSVTILMPEKYRERHLAAMKKYVVEGGGSVIGKRVELEGRRADGSIFPLEIKIQETMFRDGEWLFSAAIRDITERKEAVEAIRRHGEFLRTILESLSHPFYVIDARTYAIVMANSAAKTGNLIENIKCHKLTHHRDEPCNGHEHPCMLEKVKETKTGAVVEHIHYINDQPRNVEVHAHPVFDKDGEVIQVIEYCIDVTERKKTESERNRLFKAIEQSADVVLITDRNGMILYANPAVEKVAGYSREELIGEKPGMLKSGRHPESFYKQMWDILLSGQVWSGRITNKKKDGTFFEEDVTISPVVDSSGVISSFVALERDITRESQLAKAKDYFTSVTSHELRTPLSRIQLAQMLMNQLPLEASYRDTLEKAKDAIGVAYTNLQRIATATTLLSEITLHSSDERVKLHKLLPMLQYCVKFAQTGGAFENRRVEISLKAENIPEDMTLLCDSDMAQRAIQEILSNAVKYTPDGKKVIVSAYPTVTKTVIEITDEGIGISPDKQHLIFDAYYSLEKVEEHSSGQFKFKGGGIGLGLTIARMIMEYHDGTIAVESAGENMGTTVLLCFRKKKE